MKTQNKTNEIKIIKRTKDFIVFKELNGEIRKVKIDKTQKPMRFKI